MGRVRGEFLDDKVRVHYNLSKPDGLADEEGSMDIPYSSVCGLRPVPKGLLECTCFSYCEEVFVPKANSTIIFAFCIWEVQSVDPDKENIHKESIHGPYLKTETAAAAETSASALDTDAETSRKEKEGEEGEESGEGQTPEISPDSGTKSEENSGCGIAVLLLIIAAIVVVVYYALRSFQ